MTTPKIRYYACFTARLGGGNPVAIVQDAADMDVSVMQATARAIGAPATCFLQAIDAEGVHVRFFSPRTEYPMCGHAVIGLFTMLNQNGNGPKSAVQRLVTVAGATRVYVETAGENAPRIMLDLPVPKISAVSPSSTAIAQLLKIPLEAISGGIPALSAHADFRHLLVKIGRRNVLADIVPSFQNIARFCKSSGFQSLGLYATSGDEAIGKYHIREFCPAIGVDESAAAGTTNASLSCCLAAHGKLHVEPDGVARVVAHQGAEVGRPSEIHCEVAHQAGKVIGVRAGGTAVETFALN